MRVRRRATPGDDHDRQTSDVCLGDTGEEIRTPGPRGDETHTRLTCQLCVGCGHARGRLLVSNEDVRDLGCVVERVVDAQDVPAGKAEDTANAFRSERVDDGPTRLYGLHSPLPPASPRLRGHDVPGVEVRGMEQRRIILQFGCAEPP